MRNVNCLSDHRSTIPLKHLGICGFATTKPVPQPVHQALLVYSVGVRHSSLTSLSHIILKYSLWLFIGEYGLITLPPSQSNVTVTDSLTPNVPPRPRDAPGAQCLRFYYYFTVYDEQDWGQQIQLWIKPNNGGDRVEVGILTVNDMQRNKWESAQFELERASSNDMVRCDDEWTEILNVCCSWKSISRLWMTIGQQMLRKMDQSTLEWM